ncbi:tRNA(Ile)-lysidine synthase [Striga asiatica]|uniref:tRNA(Ile)-lysidine synthase n=1 Tax=Striga asiatica TaxID=4170 RepID=A0A5A7QEG5_STRAF|nr:tRNA(Ile)-lysidine synthase [Striga asiatica]
MSLNEARPNSVFSRRYLATQALDVSRSSATAAATLGSVLSRVMVFLTLSITSAVSFTYSSSEEAARARGGNSRAAPADRERKLRREAVEAAAEEAEGEAEAIILERMRGGVVGLGVAELGVMRVGEAMVEDYGRPDSWRPVTEKLLLNIHFTCNSSAVHLAPLSSSEVEIIHLYCLDVKISHKYMDKMSFHPSSVVTQPLQAASDGGTLTVAAKGWCL